MPRVRYVAEWCGLRPSYPSRLGRPRGLDDRAGSALAAAARGALAPQAGLDLARLFTALHPPQDVADHVRIGVELGDVVADVLLRRIAEQLQFRPIRPEDRVVRPRPVERHRGALEDVVELALTSAELLVVTSLLQDDRRLGRCNVQEQPVGLAGKVWLMRTDEDDATVAVVTEAGEGQVQRSVPERVPDGWTVFTSGAALPEALDGSPDFSCFARRDRSLWSALTNGTPRSVRILSSRVGLSNFARPPWAA